MYTVVTSTNTVEVTNLPMGTFSQKAKLIPLSRALHIAKGQNANSYIDSKYAFLMVHTHSSLCKERSFLSTKGIPVVNGFLIANLLKALQPPAELAIIHCSDISPPETQ